MAIGDVLRDALFIIAVHNNKITIKKKANAERENIACSSGRWLLKSQGKHHNLAVSLPLTSQAIKGQANHYRFNQRAQLLRMTIHCSFHRTVKSYVKSWIVRQCYKFFRQLEFTNLFHTVKFHSKFVWIYPERHISLFLWQIHPACSVARKVLKTKQCLFSHKLWHFRNEK